MAVKTKGEILEAIKARIGDDTSDEALAFIEDVTDTFDDLDSRLAESGDWKEKYEKNDADWRAKYKERFFESSDNDTKLMAEEEIEKDEPDKPKTFDELFDVKG